MTLSASLQTQLTKGLAHKQANEQIQEHTNIGNNKKVLAKSIYRAQTCNTLSDTCEAVLAKAGAASVCEAHKVMDRVVTQSHLEPLPDVFTPFPKILFVTRLYLPAVHQLLPCFSLLHFCVHSISRNFVGNIWRK